MRSTVLKINLLDTTSIIKILLVIVFASACTLSIKAAYDLSRYSDVFPAWFVPSFILGIMLLIFISLYFVFQVWKIKNHRHLLTGKQSIYIWMVMIVSFICTTAVHGFYPFHSNILSILPMLDSILKINYVIALSGLVASIALAGIYIFSPMRVYAIIGLIMITLLALIPNDNCSNPFNYWWIEAIGASPLMYVPNLYSALFVVCGLHNIHPKSVAFLTTCICIGSLLLGLGHQFRIIW